MSWQANDMMGIKTLNFADANFIDISKTQQPTVHLPTSRTIKQHSQMQPPPPSSLWHFLSWGRKATGSAEDEGTDLANPSRRASIRWKYSLPSNLQAKLITLSGLILYIGGFQSTTSLFFFSFVRAYKKINIIYHRKHTQSRDNNNNNDHDKTHPQCFCRSSLMAAVGSAVGLAPSDRPCIVELRHAHNLPVIDISSGGVGDDADGGGTNPFITMKAFSHFSPTCPNAAIPSLLSRNCLQHIIIVAPKFKTDFL